MAVVVGPRRALDCGRARVDDGSKSRRLELASLPRDVPFEGLTYARSGVTLAPAFSGSAPFWAFCLAAACQSVTIRV